MRVDEPEVAFSTLGCRLNQAESDAMGDELERLGFRRTRSNDSPDIVVVNTCTVTREATKASRMAIRRAVRDHPEARVVVIGCYAVSNPEEIEAIDGVDVVLGNDAKEHFAEALGAQPRTAPLLQIGLRRDRTVLAEPTLEDGPVKVRANLKVQTGCDEWCSFCIIPKTRGPLRSMDEERLLAEAKARVNAGAREVVLTGVHLGKYTYDTGGDEASLVRLCTRLLEIDGVWRLRLSSILSRHLTPEFVDYMAGEPRVCRYLHVPLQSGDDEVLADMNRPYRIADYIESVERAQARLPGLALATDVIVGFPTETEEAFEATMQVVGRLQFAKLHVFRYSPRPGTAAATMPDDVHPDLKRERSKRLIDLGNSIRTRFLQEHLGHPLEVLVEDERVVEGASVSSGQTGDYVRVWFEGSGLVGSLVEVVGRGTRADGIRGELVRSTRPA